MIFSLEIFAAYAHLHSFPTRRSSDLKIPSVHDIPRKFNCAFIENIQNTRNLRASKAVGEPPLLLALSVWTAVKDRKSTRLNSSHLVNPYAVFCLRKKKKRRRMTAGDR